MIKVALVDELKVHAVGAKVAQSPKFFDGGLGAGPRCSPRRTCRVGVDRGEPEQVGRVVRRRDRRQWTEVRSVPGSRQALRPRAARRRMSRRRCPLAGSRIELGRGPAAKAGCAAARTADDQRRRRCTGFGSCGPRRAGVPPVKLKCSPSGVDQGR